MGWLGEKNCKAGTEVLTGYDFFFLLFLVAFVWFL